MYNDIKIQEKCLVFVPLLNFIFIHSSSTRIDRFAFSILKRFQHIFLFCRMALNTSIASLSFE